MYYIYTTRKTNKTSFYIYIYCWTINAVEKLPKAHF